MKKNILFVAVFLAFMTTPSFAQNFVDPDELKAWLDSGKPLIIIDIQSAEDYSQKHFIGSLETNASPAMTDEEKSRLDPVVPQILSSKNVVVIVRPGAKMGRIGSYNSYKYLISKGVPEKRLFILDGGIEAWPYDDKYLTGK